MEKRRLAIIIGERFILPIACVAHSVMVSPGEAGFG